jgi:hypothetical protein
MSNEEKYTCQVCGSDSSGCTSDQCLPTLNQNLE